MTQSDRYLADVSDGLTTATTSDAAALVAVAFFWQPGHTADQRLEKPVDLAALCRAIEAACA